MYIYNITFVIEKSQIDKFLTWVRLEALPGLVNAESPARTPRLVRVAEVPGNPDFGGEEASFSLQVELPDLDSAKKWADVYLTPILGKLAPTFGAERAFAFVSILENIPL